MCILLKQHTHYQLKMQCKIHLKIAQVVFPLLFRGVLPYKTLGTEKHKNGQVFSSEFLSNETSDLTGQV